MLDKAEYSAFESTLNSLSYLTCIHLAVYTVNVKSIVMSCENWTAQRLGCVCSPYVCVHQRHNHVHIQCESKKSPLRFSNIFPKRVGIFKSIFTHLLYVPFYTRLQLSPTLTKLCHTKRDHPTNFYISLEVQLLSLLTEQMTSLLTSCHSRHVC